jgi:LacI family transcriptional regulator
VDRVIHKRGQVSEENSIKIQKILEGLNYKPNLLARSLASKRTYMLAALLPEPGPSRGYWEAPVAGIRKGWNEIADYNVKLSTFFFGQFCAESFRQKAQEILKTKPDAVLIAPVFKEETVKLVSVLDLHGIPYIFLDSNIEGQNNLSYFGQHSYQSGFLAARLLELGLPERANIAIFKPSSGDNISNQGLSREKGFNAFFEQENLKGRYNFFSVEYDLDNEQVREKQLKLFFDKYSPIAATVVFNSRVHEIAAFIEKYNIRNIRLIGYDLLKENAGYLRKGVVSFLIAQRPEEQGYQGVIALFNHLAYQQEVPKIQYMPIDILTRDNLDYYINFNK